MGRLSGRVAFVTGAARGQGRSHAVRLAREGADVIVVDICAQIASVPYELATLADLAETKRLVEAEGRAAISCQVDVRNVEGLRTAVAEGEAALGPISIVVANAGILSVSADADQDAVFRDTIDINLVGVWNTVTAAVPSMLAANDGVVILISSTQGLSGAGGDGSAGLTSYTASKHGVVGLMRSFAHWLGPHRIRVNTIHPTGVNTAMISNDSVREFAARHPQATSATANLLPVSFLEPADVSDAVAFLASDDAKFITGVTLPVDAGFTA